MISADSMHDKIRSVEAEAWTSMFSAAPKGVRTELGMATYRTADASFLACRQVPTVPFNRAFAIGPSWSSDHTQVVEGIHWLQQHAADGWVLQVDEERFAASADVLGQNGITQSLQGWVKLATGVNARGKPNDALVRAVDGEEGSHVFASLIIQGFGFPRSTFEWFRNLPLHEGWTCYVAYDEGVPCAAGALFVSGATAWFGVDTTIPAYRGKGLQLAIIARRLHDASARGVIFAMAETGRSAQSSDPDGPSFRNYKRLGFEVQHYSTNFVRDT